MSWKWILGICLIIVVSVSTYVITRSRTEYYMMNKSLSKVQALKPNQVDSIEAIWRWGKKGPVKMSKPEIVLFLAICKSDLFIAKHEKGEQLEHDKIVVRLKSGEEINLNYYFSPEQNGDEIVSQTVRSYGVFKPFMMNLFDSK